MKYKLTANDDNLVATAGADTVSGYGSAGKHPTYSGGSDTVSLGAGSDAAYISTGSIVLSGDGGNDTLVAWADQGTANRIDGGDGDDVVEVQSFDAAGAAVFGGSGKDRFTYVEGGHKAGLITYDGGIGVDRMEVGANGRAGPVVLTGFTAKSVEVLAVADGITATADILNQFQRIDAVGKARQITLIDGALKVLLDDNLSILSKAVLTDIDLSGSIASVSVTAAAAVKDATIVAGDGNDSVTFGGSGVAHLFGGAGADRLNGGAGADTLDGGAGADTLDGGVGPDTLNGGADRDTVAYFGDAHVDLTDSTKNSGAAAFDVLIAIENVKADSVVGNVRANELSGRVLSGRDGDDVLIATNSRNFAMDGGAGNDLVSVGLPPHQSPIGTVLGGAGDDTLLITGPYADYYLGAIVKDGGSGSDTLDLSGLTGGVAETAGIDSYENLKGTGFADTLSGGADGNVLNGGFGNDIINGGDGDDTVLGGGGDDSLQGGAGADSFDGGDGIDNVTYANSAVGVGADLSNDQAHNTGENSGDVFAGVENMVGSAFGDDLWGDAAANRLRGGDGDDWLHGNAGVDDLIGGAGSDTLDGGLGLDIADYSGSFVAIRLDLSGETANLGDAAGDTLNSIEEIHGTDAADYIRGNAYTNILVGGEGADTLIGGTGRDRLIGGHGADLLAGGAGRDIFEVRGKNGAADTIVDFENGVDRIDVTSAQTSYAKANVFVVDADGDGQTDDLLIDFKTTAFYVLHTAKAEIDATDFIF